MRNYEANILELQNRVESNEGKVLRRGEEEIHIADRDKTHKKANARGFGDGDYTTPTEI